MLRYGNKKYMCGHDSVIRGKYGGSHREDQYVNRELDGWRDLEEAGSVWRGG